MTRVKSSSRWLILGVAFVGVMSGTGALVGAIGGLVLVLLTRIVLTLDPDMLVLMPASIGVGLSTGLLAAFFLMARIVPAAALQPVAAVTNSETA